MDGRAAFIGILGEDGLRALRRHGHDALARSCAPDLPPARVRFVDASLRSDLEAATADRLAGLFTAPFPRRPIVASARGAARAVTVELRVQPDLACLRGHFPLLPVVPGAAQLGWALEFGVELIGTPGTLNGARSVKFERIIQPGSSFRLRLEAEPAGGELRFEYSSAAGRHSSGRIATGPRDG